MDHASIPHGQLAAGVTPGIEPEITAREVNALLARAHYGRAADAAKAIGIDEQTLSNTLWNLRRKLGVTTDLQAFYRLYSGSVTTVTVTRTTSHGE